MKTQALATKLPADLTAVLDTVCRKLGLRKNHVIEVALREKLEDLLDAEDLRQAVKEASGFHEWRRVKQETHQASRK